MHMWELMNFVKKSEEESNNEPKDYTRYVYYKIDTLPNVSRR